MGEDVVGRDGRSDRVLLPPGVAGVPCGQSAERCHLASRGRGHEELPAVCAPGLTDSNSRPPKTRSRDVRRPLVSRVYPADPGAPPSMAPSAPAHLDPPGKRLPPGPGGP